MLSKNLHNYVISQDGRPFKSMPLEDHKVIPFMKRLSHRHPSHSWTVRERFPLCGAD